MPYYTLPTYGNPVSEKKFLGPTEKKRVWYNPLSWFSGWFTREVPKNQFLPHQHKSVWYNPFSWFSGWFGRNNASQQSPLQTVPQPPIVNPTVPPSIYASPLRTTAVLKPIENEINKPVFEIKGKCFNLSDCSEALKNYVIDCTNKPKLSFLIKDLDLKSEEEAVFENFLDPVFLEYMKIPVLLGKNHFDLSTLLILDKKENPCTRQAFKPLDIEVGSSLMTEFEHTLDAFLSNRAGKTGTFAI